MSERKGEKIFFERKIFKKIQCTLTAITELYKERT